ncbi:MAG: response regulator [Chitinophagaceae bacterium]
MIKKVLIAEDHESANISVQKTLEELGIDTPDHAYYCDEALSKIRNAVAAGRSYDLLITDLSFDDDGQKQQISDGTELIKAAREAQPELKILVFSAAGEATKIEMLFDKLNIDGYVRKARNDAKELKLAIQQLSAHQPYFPRNLTQLIRKKNAHDFTEFDITIISLLSQGIRQKDIPTHLKQRNIKPSGLSSIEKRLNLMREEFNFFNNEQLVAYCKDMGII